MVVAFLGLALVAGLAVGHLGILALVALVGIAVAAAAFVDLRVTLLAMVPAMVLLPELPLGLPLRTEDLLMAPLAAAWFARLALGKERWPSTPLNTPLLVIIIVELAALLWGAFRGSAGLSLQLYSAGFFFLKTIEVTLLYFIVIASVRTERDLRLFVAVFAAAAAALGLWGIVESTAIGAGEAIVGPTGHGGYSLLGLTLVVLLATLGGLIVTQHSGRTRTLLLLAALPVAYSLTITLSRQSYVGMVAAIAVLIWVRDRRLLIPATIVAFLIPFLIPEMVQERALSIITAAPDPLSGASPYDTRLHAVLRRLPEVLSGSPVLGFGLAALPPGFLDNQYLLTVYYTGLIGLAAFLWLLWRAAVTAHRAYLTIEGELRGLGLAWLTATVGLAVAGFAGSPFVAVRVRQVYWFLAALTVAATLVSQEKQRRRAEVTEADVSNLDLENVAEVS